MAKNYQGKGKITIKMGAYKMKLKNIYF